MIIKFKEDHTGRETAMLPFKAGDVADFPNAQALELIYRLDVAKEAAEEPQPPVKPQRKVRYG